MSNAEELKDKEFITTAGEVMHIGANVITKMELTSPHLAIIDDELSWLIAAVASELVRKKVIDE